MSALFVFPVTDLFVSFLVLVAGEKETYNKKGLTQNKKKEIYGTVLCSETKGETIFSLSYVMNQ